jgi:uncharacterized protein
VKIEGSHTFDAPRELVWSLLHEPQAIQQALPGCDYFHQSADGKFHVKLNLENGPFCGRYDGIVSYAEAGSGEAFTLTLTGSGSDNTVTGQGRLALTANSGQTDLFYEGDVQAAGRIAEQSPRLVKTTANYLIRNFLEGIEQQLDPIIGSSANNGVPPNLADTFKRKTATVSMEDFLADIRRDRWVAAAVLFAAPLSIFSLLGMVLVIVLAARWTVRSLMNSKGRIRGTGLDNLAGEGT